MKLPCEKCGELIEYDGVSLPGQTCPHCGAKRPHTLKGNPLLPFLLYYLADEVAPDGAFGKANITLD